MRSVFERLAELQFRRASAFVFVAVLLSSLALPLVTELGLNSAWTALLPESAESVRDLDEIGHRVGGLSTLTIALESKDSEALQRFAKDLVPRLRGLAEKGVRSVDWNIAAYEDFVRKHKHLFAKLRDLRELRDTLDERLVEEKLKLNPLYVRLDDEPTPDPNAIIDRLERERDEAEADLEKYPDGYYLHEDGDFLALFIRSDIGGGDTKRVAALMRAVLDVADDLGRENYAADLRVEFGGSLVGAREEQEAIARELVLATSITIVLVLLAVYVFFRRLRAIPLLGAALIPPVLMTFAFAELSVDYLNTSTAFLGSIVIGNGVNPNIIWLARYFEERRRGVSIRDALFNTHQGTWIATLVASTAAAIAYGSLIITDFRGFRDFGYIGGSGMVLCWLSSILFLPAFTRLSERIRLLEFAPSNKASNLYGRLLSSIVLRWPRKIVVASAFLGLVSTGVVAYAIASDPIEYDFRNLKSVRENSSKARVINRRVGEIVGTSTQGDSIVAVLESVEEAQDLKQNMDRFHANHGAEIPYGKVRSVYDLLPEDQSKKRRLLKEIRRLALDLRRFVDDETKQKIDSYLPEKEIALLRAEDLPASVSRTFKERNGTLGRLIFIERRKDQNIWDGRFLVDWAATIRSFTLASGNRPRLAGRAPVFADMIDSIWKDTPKAIGVSFSATVLLLLVAFRRFREKLLTLAALLLGIAWMGATMAFFGMKLNFLNVLAYPITFGNGVDYGVNLMRRFSSLNEGDAEIRVQTAIQETGGAVALCSLTTIIAYSSLYTSANLALNSFGFAMAISEITCLFAAVVAMPAALLWLAQRRRA